MSGEPTDGVMGSLPRTRPHRRSAKRGPAAEPPRSPEADSQPVESAPARKRSSATAKAAARTTAPAKAKTKPATAVKGKAKAVTAATGKAKAVTAATGGAKAVTAATGGAKPATAAKSKAKTTPATPARTSSARGAAGSAGTPVRSLQSATAPRAAGDRSRKPGATSQAHHRTAARPDRPPLPRRSAPPAAEPAGAVGTAVQAAAELTEIGLKASARALRGALSRLPRP